MRMSGESRHLSAAVGGVWVGDHAVDVENGFHQPPAFVGAIIVVVVDANTLNHPSVARLKHWVLR